jgi:SRSO17 transposase
VLSVDETGAPKRGPRSGLAAPPSLGQRGPVANGVVAVTRHWADRTRHVPLGVQPYRPARRLAKGRRAPACHPTPPRAGPLIEEARAAGLPFHLVVADSIDGENAQLAAQRFAAHRPFVLGVRPAHGTWPVVEEAAHPPAFPPAEAAARRPRAAWGRPVHGARCTVHHDRHGKQLVRDVAELPVGAADGPDRPVRLVAAPLDPAERKPASTWDLATALPVSAASPEAV